MDNDKFSAVLHFYDKDGSLEATTSCPSWEHVLLRASKCYPDYVRVVPHVGSAYRVRVKDQKLNGHDSKEVVEIVGPKMNGHCPHHYDGTGSLIHDARPPIPDGVAYDYWKSKSNKTKF